MIYTPDQPLRVLSLWQPWASLMAWGEKRFETRGPTFPKRENIWVAIHASGNRTAMKRIEQPRIIEAMKRHEKEGVVDMPTAAVLAICWFRWVHRSEDVKRFRTADELAFGDWSPGRTVIHTTEMQALPRPIPWKGGQGLRHAPQSLREQIAEQLAA